MFSESPCKTCIVDAICSKACPTLCVYYTILPDNASKEVFLRRKKHRDRLGLFLIFADSYKFLRRFGKNYNKTENLQE